jgi:hypothetical protein
MRPIAGAAGYRVRPLKAVSLETVVADQRSAAIRKILLPQAVAGAVAYLT